MLSQLLAATGVLALLTVAPGPDMAVVTKRAVASGAADGLRTAGGIATGLLVWGALTAAGLAAVLAASAEAYLAVRLLGAGYLVFLGAQALWNSRRGAHEAMAPAERPGAGGTGASGGGAAPDARASGNPWRTGLVGNLLNPKIAVCYTGLLPGLAPAGLSRPVGMALLVGIHAALTLGWLGAYVCLLSRARAAFERPAVRRGLDRVMGVVLIGFGWRVATAR
ncbi:LysE family translocator [Streptomyces sp. LX-29]|uniref:LysE family translocator n=1 Tax=Streptomyces sp. LX-29 TaxID=2900152 RepID=UPI00240D2001|nr:LysE family translocator [Streptomyces sp. LX-29]WFB06450.1 LysE family translocator [Streptomyces sp. LX-29]